MIATVLVGFTLIPARLQLPFTARIRWIGDMSYAIYLIHFAVIWFMLQAFSLPEEGVLLSALLWSASSIRPRSAMPTCPPASSNALSGDGRTAIGRRAEKPHELEPAL